MTRTSYDVLLTTLQELGPAATILTPEALAAHLRNAIATWDLERTANTDTQWGVQYDWTDSDGRTHTDVIEYDHLSDALDAIATMRPKGGTGYRLVRRIIGPWEITALPPTWPSPIR